jgi:beta-lactam-binding protein with PASTA domain
VRRIVLLLAAGLTLVACGDEPRPANEPRVTLKLDVPSDGGSVRAETVAVRGTVRPADADVRVAGEDAQVESGEFSAEVTLEPGGNVIDVTAAAPGRRPATDAVRVLRDMRVKLPALVGQESDAAVEALRELDLRADVQENGSWLDRVLGGAMEVCSTTPPAGTPVDPRSTITLETDPTC